MKLQASLAKLKRSTMVWASFLLFNVTAGQITSVQLWVTPRIAHHPRVAAAVASIFGALLLFHEPGVQLFLKKLPFGHPTIPAEAGAQVGDVEVVPGPQ